MSEILGGLGVLARGEGPVAARLIGKCVDVGGAPGGYGGVVGGEGKVGCVVREGCGPCGVEAEVAKLFGGLRVLSKLRRKGVDGFVGKNGTYDAAVFFD